MSLFWLAGLACHPDKQVDSGHAPVVEDDTGGDRDPDADLDTGGEDTEQPCEGLSGTVSGTVSVDLYFVNDDGDVEQVAWSEYSDDFPWGAIYVGAYTGSDDDRTEIASDTIAAPSIDGDSYSMTLDSDADEAHLYAILDEDQDRVIGTFDPITYHGDPVTVCNEDGTVDLVFMFDLGYDPSGSGGGGDGGGGDGGEDSGLMGYGELYGDIVITNAWAGGEAAAMLLDTNDQGPYETDWTDPQATDEGAESSYSIVYTTDYGDMHLVGCWDSNGNLLSDPSDTWGAYFLKSGVNANPIRVMLDERTEADVQIPLDDGGLELVPWIRINGELTSDYDMFSDAGDDAVVYVAAMRFAPEGDNDASDLEDEYDVQVFSGSELDSGALAYELLVPGESIMYLWAWIDVDGDGILQEVDEPVVNANTEQNGRITTGSSSSTYDLHVLFGF